MVMEHTRDIFPSSMIHGITHFGLHGVDLFFVISGFIMVFNTQKKTSYEFLVLRKPGSRLET